MYTIENAFIKVAVKAQGAELCSLVRKEDGKEYIWQGDPAYWKRHAPVLFPVVGTLNPKRGLDMGRHGFARDMMFTCEGVKEESLVMVLKASEKTKEVYPYDFGLRITYTLEENRLNIGYEVVNEGTGEMPFSIGAHPAFNCDLFGGHVELEFEKEEALECLCLDVEKGLLNGETLDISLKDRKLKIKSESFKNDALVFENLESTWIRVLDPSTKTSVKVTYGGFPFMGIWSPGAPFVCIEPWYGVTDNLVDEGPLSDKRGIVLLGPNENFDAVHSIEVEAFEWLEESSTQT
ncbi:aldose 1-epimerase family protein [Fusibacter sp. JL216-2]|uniref:aldose 1-epimerase family protein n=1 Tax=Fusibacter sp. JL216-2 TaxID=3071453 RepID=UPI003D333C2E